MDTLRFDLPYLLLAFPLLLFLLVWFSRKSQASLGISRKRWLLILRSVLLTFVLLALSSPHTTRTIPASRQLIFCLDVSESMDPAELAAALDAMEKLVRGRAPGDAAALLAFAGRTRTVRPPGTEPLSLTEEERSNILYRKNLGARLRHREGGDVSRLQQWRDSLRTMETRLEGIAPAVAGLGVSDRENVVVVMTDGFVTHGEEHPRLLDAMSRVSWVPLNRRPVPEVIVEELLMPNVLQANQALDARVRIRSTVSTRAVLQVAIDDVLQSNYSKTVEIHPSVQEIEIGNVRIPPSTRPGGTEGYHTLQVFVYPEQDTELRNNTLLGAVEVAGKTRVLVIEGTSRAGKALEEVLLLQDFSVTREPVDQFESVCDRLHDFGMVVFVHVDPARCSRRSLEALRDYVRTDGGGFLAVCGSRLTSMKGYTEGMLADLLPVHFSPPKSSPPVPDPVLPSAPAGSGGVKHVKAPVVSLLLLIDKSGSMAGNNLTLAKEACLAAAETLAPQDQIGVIAFDAKPNAVLSFVSPDQKQHIEDRILRIFADGGTNLYPAMVQAREMFRTATGSVRHGIILTDGLTPAADFSGLVDKMAADGITWTTVCVGSSEFDANLLSQISRLGHGRFLFTDNFKNVPRIFTQETRQVVREARRPSDPPAPPVKQPPPPPAPTVPVPALGATAVRAGAESDILKGIVPNFPSLGGFHGSVPKSLAQPVLVTETGHPLLAAWRNGLGHAAVWTSDLADAWGSSWGAWEPFPKLMAQTVRALSGTVRESDAGSSIRVERLRGTARVTYHHAGLKKIARVDGQLLFPQRKTMPFQLYQTDLADLYQCDIPLEETHTVYHLGVHLMYEEGLSESIRVSIPSGYASELSSTGTNDAFFRTRGPASVVPLEKLDEVVRHDRKLIEQRQGLAMIFWILALLLLPLDVAVQRWR